MANRHWNDHIGDGQRIRGMAKHLSSIPGKTTLRDRTDGSTREDTPGDPGGKTYWTVHPKPGACEKCRAMAGVRYETEPKRPHPNCRCEIKKHEHKTKKHYIQGRLDSYGESDTQVFGGGGYVDVEVTSEPGGALLPGIQIHSNWTDWQQSLIPQGMTVKFDLNVLTDTNILWSITLVSATADNTPLRYTIIYEQ